MLRDEAIAAIKLVMANRSSALIDTWLKQNGTGFDLAQTTLEMAPEKPWFLLSEDSFASTTSGEERLALPSDFLSEDEDAVLRYVPTDTTKEEIQLKKYPYDDLKATYKRADTGEPEAYAKYGNYFRIFPLPNAAYQIRMVYYKKGTRLANNVENEWLKWAPMLFMGSAGLIIAQGPVRDAKAAEIFSGWIQTGSSLLATENENQKMVNRDLQMGGAH
jgi:hypothetical protein